MLDNEFPEWDPTIGPRLAPAWDALTAELADGQWHLRAEVIKEMLARSDIQHKTAQSLISQAITEGEVKRKGGKKQRLIAFTHYGMRRWTRS